MKHISECMRDLFKTIVNDLETKKRYAMNDDIKKQMLKDIYLIMCQYANDSTEPEKFIKTALEYKDELNKLQAKELTNKTSTSL